MFFCFEREESQRWRSEVLSTSSLPRSKIDFVLKELCHLSVKLRFSIQYNDCSGLMKSSCFVGFNILFVDVHLPGSFNITRFFLIGIPKPVSFI